MKHYTQMTPEEARELVERMATHIQNMNMSNWAEIINAYAAKEFEEFVKYGPKPNAEPAAEPNSEPETITVPLYRMAFRGNNIGFYGRWENPAVYEIIIKELETDKYKMCVFEEEHRLKYSYWGDIDDIERAALHLNIELDFMNTDMFINHKSRYDAERIAALGEL